MEKPRTITIECKRCLHVYGAWRSHCDACGLLAPASVREEMLKPREKDTPKRRSPSKREVQAFIRKTGHCIACWQRGAKAVCPTCNEPIHATCLSLHKAPCAQFQRERDEAINALDNPAAVAAFVNKKVKAS